MKRKTYLTHGVIIATGILLGLLAQIAIKSDSKPSLPALQKSKTSRNITRANSSFENLSLVLDLIKRDGRANPKRTFKEDAALESTLYDLNSRDYPEVAKALAERNNPSDHILILDLFLAWGHQDPHGALKAIETMPLLMQDGLERRTLKGWVTSDAKAALNYVVRKYPPLPPGMRGGPLPDEELWNDFADEEPKQALAFTSELTNAKERRKIEDTIIRRLSYQEPEEALKWVLAHREGEELSERVESVISRWAVIGQPQKILNQILALPEELQTNEAFERLGEGLADGSKLNQATELLDEIPEVYRKQFLGGLIRNASSYNPTRAVELSQLLPDGKIKQQAYSDIGEFWADEDPVAAGEWLVTLPRSPARDQAIKGFTQSQSSGDPALVVAWASDIDNRSLKRTPLINGLQRWIDNDATAARKWMDAQPEERLPAAIKQQILENFEE